MRVLIRLLVPLVVCPFVFAETVTPTAMAPVSMMELANAPGVTSLLSGTHQRHQRLRPLAAAPYYPSFTAEASTPAPPPKATVGFRTLARANIYPADAAGAVSAHYVVGATNDGVTVYDRGGNRLSGIGLGSFWTDPSLPVGGVYSPRVIYDAVADRWLMTTLFEIDGAKGRFLVAVSDSGDPTGMWKRYSVPFDDRGDRVGDMPRIGQTADLVMLTVTQWVGDTPVGMDFIAIHKPYATPPAIDLIFTASDNEEPPIASSDNTHKLATADPDLVGGGAPGVVVYDYVGIPFHAQENPKTYHAAPGMYSHSFFGINCGSQLGSANLMDCGDTSLQNGVLRNGAIWLVQTVMRTSFRTAIVVWKITGDTAKTYLIEDPESLFAFPSIAVNRHGAALIAYSVYTAQTYPSAGYSYIDPQGNLSAPGILKSGDTPYLLDRWGDYTTTLVDPVDDTSFWTVQIYPVQTNGWATWWSYIPVSGISGRGRAVRR